MFSTRALSPASVSPVISPGFLAFGYFPCNGFDMSCRRTVQCSLLHPITGSIFEHPRELSLKTNSKLQAQYRRTAKSFNDLIALLKAA
jgi:hypothetical protein